MGAPKHVRADGFVRGRSQTRKVPITQALITAPITQALITAPITQALITAPITHAIITVTIPEFRLISGIGRTRTYELLDAGEIESIHVGTRRLILVESYRQFVERRRAKTSLLKSG